MIKKKLKNSNTTISDMEDLVYIQLPTHPGRGQEGVSVKQIDIMEDYRIGKDVKIILDIDKNEEIIGIEIMMY